MGHYASDLDPKGWEQQNDRIGRSLALRAKIENLPLSAFKVCDLPLLNKLYSYDYADLSKDEFEQLLKRVEDYEASTSHIDDLMNRMEQDKLQIEGQQP